MLRNNLFHGQEISDAKFENQAISDETTIEQLFLASQFLSMQFDKIEEMIDDPHAIAERWCKWLIELGESLR